MSGFEFTPSASDSATITEQFEVHSKSDNPDMMQFMPSLLAQVARKAGLTGLQINDNAVFRTNLDPSRGLVTVTITASEDVREALLQAFVAEQYVVSSPGIPKLVVFPQPENTVAEDQRGNASEAM